MNKTFTAQSMSMSSCKQGKIIHLLHGLRTHKTYRGSGLASMCQRCRCRAGANPPCMQHRISGGFRFAAPTLRGFGHAKKGYKKKFKADVGRVPTRHACNIVYPVGFASLHPPYGTLDAALCAAGPFLNEHVQPVLKSILTQSDCGHRLSSNQRALHTPPSETA